MGAQTSIAELISQGLTRPRGAVAAIASALTLLLNAWILNDRWYLFGALMFACVLIGLLGLGRLRLGAVREPLATRLRAARDLAAVLFVVAGMFVPLTWVVVMGNHMWNVPSLAGAVLMLWLALDAAVGHWRRARDMALYIGLGWMLVIVFRQHLVEMPVWAATAFFAGVLAYSLVAVARALGRLPQWMSGRRTLVGLGAAASLAPVTHVVLELAELL